MLEGVEAAAGIVARPPLHQIHTLAQHVAAKVQQLCGSPPGTPAGDRLDTSITQDVASEHTHRIRSQ